MSQLCAYYEKVLTLLPKAEKRHEILQKVKDSVKQNFHSSRMPNWGKNHGSLGLRKVLIEV